MKTRYDQPESSAGKFEDLTRRYVATVANSYLRHIDDERFNPNSNSTYIIGNLRFGPKRGTAGSLYVPAAAIIDNDGVLTAKDTDNMYKTLNFSWLEALQQLSSRIRSNHSVLEDAFKTVMERLMFWRTDYTDDMVRLAKKLKKAGLTKDVYMRSIPITVKNATLAPGALETVYKLRNVLGIEPAQCSGSPQDLLEQLGSQRLGISPSMSEGSRLVWNNSGELADIWSNVGYHKIRSRNTLLKRVGCSSDMTVYATDKLETDDKPLLVNAGLGLGIYVKGAKGWFRRGVDRLLHGGNPQYEFSDSFEGFEGKIVVASEIFAEDFTSVLKPIGLWMRSRIISGLYRNPEIYLGVIETARSLKESERGCRRATGKKFYAKRDEYIEIAKRLRGNKVVEFITYPSVSGVFDNMFGELEELANLQDTDTERQKKLITDSFNQLEEGLIEPNFNKRDVSSIKKIIDEWHERFPDREWINYGF